MSPPLATPMQAAAESSSYWFDYGATLQDGVVIAMSVFGAVPAGWQPLWRDTVRQLLAVRTPARERSLGNLLPDFDTDALQLSIPFADRVLQGIARRCTQRSRCICRQCGRLGRIRWFGMHEAVVLCPRCAAPELLHRAIDDLVKYPGIVAASGRVDGPGQVPEVLRRAFLREAERLAPSGRSAAPSMDRAGLDAWTGRLRRLKRFLPPPSCLAAP